ncbi:hypothetical protein Rleg2_5617 (plasmid) [Rhizobium leguminosarum bv. trifolii WSM2304]|uniref:Uncharacterized protein n=1 Tax=Rhizobium leguminosarum bv. trifolii (strain WSM2304) TaxID=395492 RepID=A0ABF7QXM0_RHILW|nr:hypothetical protein [Rhizobium leguminosarum]ACI58792.1 hypothetical protein Rleg2_5617 [Rhizobium leguminosarum bv. trifolii WSM2304]
MNIPPFGKRKSTPLIGWWSMLEEEERLVRSDGASVQFLGFVNQGDEPGKRGLNDRRWMRFEADDTIRSMQFLVQWRDVFSPQSPRALIWRLDYARSLEQSGIVALDYQEWVAMDRFICDALVCWPQREVTGLRPTLIAVSGGWHQGQWREEYYRTFDMAYLGGRVDETVSKPSVIRQETPRQWRFVPATQEASAEDIVAIHERLADARPEAIEALVVGLLPKRPHLQSGERFLVPLRQYGGQTQWLYIDDEIITDRIVAHTHKPSWMFRIDNAALIGTIDRKRRTEFKFDHAWQPKKIGAVKREYGTFSHVFRNRLRDLCENGLWQWEEVCLQLHSPESEGKGSVKQTCIQRPKRVRLDEIVSVAGRVATVRLVIAESLDGSDYADKIFSDAFNDNPAPLNSSEWEQFEFQADAFSLMDGSTQQQLELREIVAGSGSVTDGCEGLFCYRDNDSEYLLVVIREGRRANHQAGKWVLDHNASRSKNQQSGVPPISDERWYRMARFSRDALLAWPDTDIFGPGPSGLAELGGCFQGRWEPELRRWQRNHLKTSENDPSTGRYNPEASLLLPWKAFDPGADVGAPSERIEAALRRLADRSAGDENIGQTRRLRWLRADGRAIFYLHGWQTLRAPPDGDPYQAPVFEYLDDDITVHLYPKRFDEYDMQSLALIEVNPASGLYGKVEPTQSLYQQRRPTEEIWYRVVTAIESQIDRISEQLAIHGLYTVHGYDGYATRTLVLNRS